MTLFYRYTVNMCNVPLFWNHTTCSTRFSNSHTDWPNLHDHDTFAVYQSHWRKETEGGERERGDRRWPALIPSRRFWEIPEGGLERTEFAGNWCEVKEFPLIPGLAMTNIAIEHCPVEIVDVPMKNGGSFHCFFVCFPAISVPMGRLFMSLNCFFFFFGW